MLRKIPERLGIPDAARTPERSAFMVFGHNTNLKLRDAILHVQTENRGEPHRLIDTTVYFRGRVLHRRTAPYVDLLPMNAEREEALRLRVDEQHRKVIEEIRSGILPLEIPGEKPAAPPPAEPKRFSLELSNAKSWLSGKNARLQIAVKDGGAPVAAALVRVEFEGSEGGVIFRGLTDAQGSAMIEFELPRIVSAEAAMLITAESKAGSGQLRYALRAKPRMVTS